MAKSGTDDVLKKDPAAGKAPDAGAVDSDKAKAMFATHAPSPTAVCLSKFTRPTGPPTAPTGAVEGALKKDIPAAESDAEASVDEEDLADVGSGNAFDVGSGKASVGDAPPSSTTPSALTALPIQRAPLMSNLRPHFPG